MTLQDLHDYFGKDADIARALGITPQSVGAWTYVSRYWQLEIEKMTNGQLKAEERK